MRTGYRSVSSYSTRDAFNLHARADDWISVRCPSCHLDVRRRWQRCPRCNINLSGVDSATDVALFGVTPDPSSPLAFDRSVLMTVLTVAVALTVVLLIGVGAVEATDSPASPSAITEAPPVSEPTEGRPDVDPIVPAPAVSPRPTPSPSEAVVPGEVKASRSSKTRQSPSEAVVPGEVKPSRSSKRRQSPSEAVVPGEVKPSRSSKRRQSTPELEDDPSGDDPSGIFSDTFPADEPSISTEPDPSVDPTTDSVVVPNVWGLSCEAAMQEVIDAGMRPRLIGGTTGAVQGQSPGSGLLMPPDTTVHLHCADIG
ncbi:PASTA domain-containing protein [Actinoplanes sp. NPDC051470]|uniref:PASTA domain-containing protein n=1 Tax=Actinoplanes sp. NPDC051470 TaxID=3157224 RepID=UPI00341B7E0A